MTTGAFRVDGKKALVTGSHRGLGAGIALALAEAGADIICHGHEPEGDATCAAIQELGRKSAYVTADLSTPEGCSYLFDSALKAFGAVDILVNNAGIIRRADAVEFSRKDWDDVISVNLNAVFQLSQLAGQHMIKRGGGKIVNIASLLAFQGGIRVPSYAASKGAVAQLTKAFANEWAPHKVNVNAIAPGYMATENTAALREDADRSRQIMERIPAGRWGLPADLGGAAVFLCSPAGEYVHGHVLVVDGGWMAR